MSNTFSGYAEGAFTQDDFDLEIDHAPSAVPTNASIKLILQQLIALNSGMSYYIEPKIIVDGLKNYLYVDFIGTGVNKPDSGYIGTTGIVQEKSEAIPVTEYDSRKRLFPVLTPVADGHILEHNMGTTFNIQNGFFTFTAFNTVGIMDLNTFGVAFDDNKGTISTTGLFEGYIVIEMFVL